nr:DUF1674 domain-containing protein [Afifella pfennigii]
MAPAERQSRIAEAAKRALAEAEERRAELTERAREAAPLTEFHGPTGPEPVRYGDWERKGKAVDF